MEKLTLRKSVTYNQKISGCSKYNKIVERQKKKIVFQYFSLDTAWSRTNIAVSDNKLNFRPKLGNNIIIPVMILTCLLSVNDSYIDDEDEDTDFSLITNYITQIL